MADVELATLIGVNAVVVASVLVLDPTTAVAVGVVVARSEAFKGFSLKGGGDGDVVAVEDDTLLVMVVCVRPSVLLWLDVDSALKRFAVGG